ncbi:PIH1 domain-containing protein 1 isoform X1 [Tachyglossus aculeatus]|uniref:PIH1 domain-containing protein 1 isoform X1 n=1 Tax=Tachyglossus aculeatus TaxID=9261 RepID=UPI0018F52E04|nr:PIH1 domain-containing protein 1 isoform X1 [Tachyglossus aculeatus]
MAVQADDSLLFPGQNEEDEDEALYERILLQATQKIINARSPMPDSKQIRPQPGFCIKTRSPQGKVFINVCRSPSIPPPADLTEQELLCVIEDDQTAFRVPMSLGEPHAELDKSGQGCTAYDVAINSDFYEKLRTNDFFLEFFVTVALEGLSSKYGVELSSEWRLLKHRPFLGSISEQNIRTHSRPGIQELASPEAPALTLWLEPPHLMKAEIALPKLDSARSLTLSLGEDRLVLAGVDSPYRLDVFVPHNVVQEQSRAAFNRESKILTVTMPLQTPCR